MITIYGMHTCPYCEYILPQIEGKEEAYRFVDIGEHVRNMHEFMSLRDHNPAFDHSKEVDDIGIPAFVLADGSVTLDPALAGLEEYPGPQACTIADHAAGKSGC